MRKSPEAGRLVEAVQRHSQGVRAALVGPDRVAPQVRVVADMVDAEAGDDDPVGLGHVVAAAGEEGELAHARSPHRDRLALLGAVVVEAGGEAEVERGGWGGT